MKPTTVISVRGRKRAELEADPDFVYVGRRVRYGDWPDTIWGNPFKPAGKTKAALTECFRKFRHALKSSVEPRFVRMRERLHQLRGRKIGCWCGEWKPGEPEIPCHACVLAVAANELDDAGLIVTDDDGEAD